MIIQEANVCKAVEKNSEIITITDDNNVLGARATQFLLNDINPTILNIGGGEILNGVGVVNCASKHKEIVGFNYYHFMREYGNIDKKLYSTVRRALCPLDTTPLNTLSNEQGIASMGSYGINYIIASLKIPNSMLTLNKIFSFMEDTDYSTYNYMRLDREKIALFYNRETNNFELKLNPNNNIENAFFIIKEYNRETKKYEFKQKKIYTNDNTILGKDVIEVYNNASLKQEEASKEDYDYCHVGKYVDLEITSKYINNIYLNKTPFYQRVVTSSETRIVYPFGIYAYEGDVIAVYNYPDIIAEISTVNSEYPKLFDEPVVDQKELVGHTYNPSDIYHKSGYHIYAKYAAVEMGDEVVDYKPSMKTSKTIQIGPLVILPVIKDKVAYKAEVYYDRDNNYYVYNDLSNIFHLRFDGDILYARLHNQIDFTEVAVENYSFILYVEDEDEDETSKYVLGIKPFEVLYNSIERTPYVLHQINYIQEQGKLHMVMGISNMLNGRAETRNYGYMACAKYYSIRDTLHKRPYNMTQVYEASMYSITAANDMTAKVEEFNVYSDYNIGIKTDSGFSFALDNVTYMQIDTKEANELGYPFNSMNDVSETSEYNPTEYGVVIWTYTYNGKQKDLMFIEKSSNIIFNDKNVNECVCKSLDIPDYQPITKRDNNISQIAIFTREHSLSLSGNWEKKIIAPRKYTKGITNGLDLEDSIPTTTEVEPGLRLTLFAELHPSSAEEYMFDNIGYSVLYDSHYINIKEIGVFLFITEETYNSLESGKFELYKDKNLRGVKYTNGDIEVKFYINMSSGNRLMHYNIKNGDEYYSYYGNVNCMLLTDKLEFNTNGGNKRPANTLLPEVAINYMYKNGYRQHIIGFKDESDYLIDDTKMTVELVEAEEGSQLIAKYDGEKIQGVSYMSMFNALMYDRPYLLYGEPFLKAKAVFYFFNMKVSYDNEEEFKEDLYSRFTGKFDVSSTDIRNATYTTYITATQKPFANFRFNVDPKILSIKPITTKVPRRNKVELNIELGIDNELECDNLLLTERDFIYNKINGYVYANYTDESNGNEIVKYYKGLTNTLLNREIVLDVQEQTSIRNGYYPNAKTQLIQDLREDTVNKRIEGSGIYVKYDLQKVYEAIHTIEDKVWNIPTSFLCDDSKEECVINKIRQFTNTVDYKVTHDDVVLQSNKALKFINNPNDEDVECTISIKNTSFFDGHFGYNFTNIYNLYNKKFVLYSKFADVDVVLDENHLMRGV